MDIVLRKPQGFRNWNLKYSSYSFNFSLRDNSNPVSVHEQVAIHKRTALSPKNQSKTTILANKKKQEKQKHILQYNQEKERHLQELGQGDLVWRRESKFEIRD